MEDPKHTEEVYCPCVTYFDPETEHLFRKLQQEIFEMTGARASLDEWRPHVTVGSGTVSNPAELELLVAELQAFATLVPPFQISLSGFKFFDNWKGAALFNCQPYVVSVGVTLSPALLSFVERLRTILHRYRVRYDAFPYNPHLTLAFRDLDKRGYDLVRERFADEHFFRAVVVTSFSLAAEKTRANVFEELFRFPLPGAH